jgi:hypothetical protein
VDQDGHQGSWTRACGRWRPGGQYQYTIDTAINDHSGESQQPGSTCTPEPDVDEACVNKELTVGESQGRFPIESNCHQLTDDILDKCRKGGPKHRLPVYHFVPFTGS